MAAEVIPAVRGAGEVGLWYRDPVSCLQSAFATLLLHAGEDPLPVLGLAWEFLYLPGETTSEEFSWPCRTPGDLGRSLAPHHAVSSRWRRSDGDDPLGDLEAVLADGRLPIVAVDNFFLPFRPAFHDVHAAHLVVVHDVDRATGSVQVADAIPPAFCGPVATVDFLASWGSANPRDRQDAFFSAAPIHRRWLDVALGTPYPSLDPGRLRAALLANRAGFDAPAGAGWAGLAGLRDYSVSLLARARAAQTAALSELYTFGWGMQAQAALHGELLRQLGIRWSVPELREAGRAVEHVAHAWTGLRVTGAHGRLDPPAVVQDLARHGWRLERGYEQALETVARAEAAL